MSNTTFLLEQQFAGLNEQQLRRVLIELTAKRKLGLNWEYSHIERDQALNSDLVLPHLNEDLSCSSQAGAPYRNLIIEGDNYDALRLLRATHANKIRVIYIDPPYNTGNKDWVYNDRYVGEKDRWRHSQWLEFLYQRLMLARDLMTPDGVIMVSINDENRAKLEMLMDEIFPSMRVGSFVWKCRPGGNDTKGALLSTNHEHVLVYSNGNFSFAGDNRGESDYANPDNDPRGEWINGPLIKNHTARQRPEAYYSIHNPETDVWYLCDPDSVWRFASVSRPQKKKLQADPIETLIKEKRVLWPGNDRVAIYENLAELKKAIEDGTAPHQLKIYLQLKDLKKAATKDERVARLLTYIEPLENWVGRKIGYGKPRHKRFRSNLLRDVAPLSSWLNPIAEKRITEDDDYDDEVTLTVGATSEGTMLYKEITGSKDFPYPKPLSLVRGLILQAAKPGDIVLDFFAGSGTTAHAVLDLQEELPGLRFILCSSTEATKAEPDKNICRDVCATRVRKVIDGYGDVPGLGGDFAYLKLSKLAVADARLDATDDQSFQLLSLRETHCATPLQSGPAWTVAADPELAVVYLPTVNKMAINALAKLPQPRLAVYSSRPQTVAQHLETSGKRGESYAIGDVILPVSTDEFA